MRWFTPIVEVDLCGHATLATSFILDSLGIAGPYRFRTRSGTLVASADQGFVTLDFPARRFEAVATPAGLAAAIGCVPVAVLQSADLIAVLESAEAVRNLRPKITDILALPGGALIVTGAWWRWR